ncbi:putative acyl-CoA dehydrogenase fadE25 [Ditylenchus destructor]|nr:putative acyl-CoA dehydrogenase fadE25 [Ditylenchus destructor]
MPNATQHLFDEQWLQASALSAQGPLSLLDWKPSLESKMPLGLPRWRNSMGFVLASVATPVYASHARKQASTMLVNEAARVALASADIAPAQRADWVKSQSMDARLRERLSIVDGQVVARPWDPIEGRTELRYAIPSGVTSAGERHGVPHGFLSAPKLTMLLSEDHRAIQDAIRAYVQDQIAPKAAEWDKSHCFPAEELKGLAALGCYGVAVPTEYDGAGLDYLSLALILEEIAAGDGATSTVVSVNNCRCAAS